MGGDVISRHYLGDLEMNAGNINRGMKHFMIAAGAGRDDSLTIIREGYLNGCGTKKDFEKALCAHKESTDEMESEQREAGAAWAAAAGGL